jgi:cell division protein FtsB
MPVETAVTWALGLICAVLGWWLRELWNMQQTLQKDLTQLERGLGSTYMRKDDLRQQLDQIMVRFDRLEARLDARATREVGP